MIDEAREFMEIMPSAEAGQCVMMNDQPFHGSLAECRAALAAGRITFRPGRLESVVGVPQPALVYPGPPPSSIPRRNKPLERKSSRQGDS